MEGEQNAAGQELVLMGAAGMGEDRVDRRHGESYEPSQRVGNAGSGLNNVKKGHGKFSNHCDVCGSGLDFSPAQTMLTISKR